jgi:hypothetical protein
MLYALEGVSCLMQRKKLFCHNFFEKNNRSENFWKKNTNVTNGFVIQKNIAMAPDLWAALRHSGADCRKRDDETDMRPPRGRPAGVAVGIVKF